MATDNREIKKMWDARLVEVTDLVLYLGYRLKDLALHFDVPVATITSMLNRRGISLVTMRYRHSKGQL